MKKLIFLAVLLLSVSFANAQFSFGIKAGYNSSLTFDNISSVSNGDYDLEDVNSELANGFHAGIFSRVFIKNLYIQPELLYNMQKKDYQFSILDGAENLNVNKYVTFSTVDIPLLLGYKLLDLKVVNLRAFAGPKIRLNAGSQISYGNLTAGEVDREALKGEFKNANIGLEAGAGIDVFMFALDVRFNLINDIYQATWQTKPDLNSNFVISLGWKLF